MRDLRKLSIGLLLTLYVTFGHESFLKGPVVLFTQELIELRLDGLLTQIELSFRLGDLYIPLRYPDSWKDRGESLMRSKRQLLQKDERLDELAPSISAATE